MDRAYTAHPYNAVNNVRLDTNQLPQCHMFQLLQIDPLTAFNTLLLLLSLAVTLGILRGAARDNIRTTIEGLDDVALQGNRKLVPMLHRFHYRGLDRRSSCEVLIRQYVETEAGSVPEGFLEHIEPDIDWEDNKKVKQRFDELFAKNITRIQAMKFDDNPASYIDEVEYSVDGLIVRIETKNPVYVKRIVDAAMSGIRGYSVQADRETERDVETENE